jgi:hypothetical protein
MDEQAGMEQEVRELWPSYKASVAKNGPPRYVALMGSKPYFLDDRQFLPLQAADLYAWHVRDHLIRRPDQPGRAGTTDDLALGSSLHTADNESGGLYVLAPEIAAHLLLNTFDEFIIGGSVRCLRHDRI